MQPIFYSIVFKPRRTQDIVVEKFLYIKKEARKRACFLIKFYFSSSIALVFFSPQLRITRNLLPRKLITSAVIPPTACPVRL